MKKLCATPIKEFWIALTIEEATPMKRGRDCILIWGSKLRHPHCFYFWDGGLMTITVITEFAVTGLLNLSTISFYPRTQVKN